jgi:hypothetical protein
MKKKITLILLLSIAANFPFLHRRHCCCRRCVLFAGRNWLPLSFCYLFACCVYLLSRVSFFGVCRFLWSTALYIRTCAQTRIHTHTHCSRSCSILIFLYIQFSKKSNLKELRRRDPSFPFLSMAAAATAVAVSFLATFVAFHSVDNQTTSHVLFLCCHCTRPSITCLSVYRFKSMYLLTRTGRAPDYSSTKFPYYYYYYYDAINSAQ